MFWALFILYAFAQGVAVRLELRDIKDGTLKQEYRCPPTQFPVLKQLAEEEDVAFQDPLVFRLRFQKTGQIVEVDGELSATVKMHCGRCLTAFDQPISADFSLTFTPLAVREDSEEDEVELEADDLGLIHYRGETLDLLEPLQEQIVMSVPIGPVCRDDCQGLCSECGGDLNNTRCNCVKKPFNNKFGALADLKLDKS